MGLIGQRVCLGHRLGFRLARLGLGVRAGLAVLCPRSMATLLLFLSQILYLRRSKGSVFRFRELAVFSFIALTFFITAVDLDLQNVHIIWIAFRLLMLSA